VITGYVNGAPFGSVVNSTVFNENQAMFGISFGDGLQPMAGFCDELRVTKMARYQSSFVPPYRSKGK
jgi:hypothetical protein